MRTSYVYRLLLKPLCLVLLGFLAICSCQRDINQAASLAPLNLTAPSGMRIAASASELERKVASVFHQDAQNIKVIRVDYLDSKVGFACTIQYLNQLTKEIHKMVMFNYGEEASNKSAKI